MSETKRSQLIGDHSISHELMKKEREKRPDSSQEETISEADREVFPPPIGGGPPPPLTKTLQQKKQTQKQTAGKGRKTRFQAKRILLRIGVPLTILIVLILVGTALYTSFAFQDVTAFQVGSRKAVPLYIGGGGIVYPRQQIPVSYAAAGHISNVIVKVGDQVKAGQPLITLDQSQVNAQVSLAANDVAAAQAYLNSVSSASPYNPVTVANAQQRLQVAQNRYNSLTSQSSSILHDGNLGAPAAGI